MKASDIIYDALIRLGMAGEYERGKLSLKDDEIKKLFYMLNHILSEVSEICRIKVSDEAAIEGGTIAYKTLSKKFYKAVNVTANGMPIAFKERLGGLKTEMKSGPCTVEYYARLSADGIDDEVELPPNVDSSVITLGIAAEYNTSRFLTNEALAYEKRYKEALARSVFQSKRVIIKTSRW